MHSVREKSTLRIDTDFHYILRRALTTLRSESEYSTFKYRRKHKGRSKNMRIYIRKVFNNATNRSAILDSNSFTDGNLHLKVTAWGK